MKRFSVRQSGPAHEKVTIKCTKDDSKHSVSPHRYVTFEFFSLRQFWQFCQYSVKYLHLIIVQ